MNVFGAAFHRNNFISFRFHFSSNVSHLVVFSRFLQVMNFRAVFTVVFLAFHASHRGFWCFYCFAVVLDFTHIADDDVTPQLQSSLELQEVFHEEVFLYTMHSIFRNNEFCPTQRTRHLVSWFLLLRFSCPTQTFNTECVNAWQNSWISECSPADRTFCYFSEMFSSFFKCVRHLDLHVHVHVCCECIKENIISNCSDENWPIYMHGCCP